MKQIILIVMLALLIGCVNQVTDNGHGCNPDESWCEVKNTCLTDEPCVDDKTIQNFAACADAGYPVMESFPRQCRTSTGRNFVEPIPESSDCESVGGTWNMAAQECTGIDSAACEEIGGRFNSCASACRNDPTATVCTMQCVQVCEFDTTVDVPSGFCGTSTESPCDEDDDCRTGGCSGQICQSSKEEGLASTCEYRDCYNNEAYDMRCGCFEGRCKWS